jgi:hypothetical protein
VSKWPAGLPAPSPMPSERLTPPWIALLFASRERERVPACQSPRPRGPASAGTMSLCDSGWFGVRVRTSAAARFALGARRKDGESASDRRLRATGPASRMVHRHRHWTCFR